MARIAAARSLEDLIVWKRAHEFVVEVYEVSKGFPRDELFGLTSQFRRAAVSVPANIVEGFKKRGKMDKLRFLNIAQGSAEECRYYLVLARDLHFIDPSTLMPKIEEVSRLLESYMGAVRASST